MIQSVLNYTYTIRIISILFLFNVHSILGQTEIQNTVIEEIRFSYKQFTMAGNLYLPQENGKKSLAIWIHGDGPDLRTGKFPGTSFFNTFLDHGYAYFRYDKPGSGDSKGSFTDSLLFYERAGIVSKAVEILKTHHQIDSSRIGLVGSSQAGYVMPLVLKMRDDIAFMIGLSLPAMTGHEQWAYLLKMQMICEGYSRDQAEEFSRMHLKLIYSKTYQEFQETITYFEKNPITLTSLKGYDENYATRLPGWWPLDWVQTQSFNPMNIISQTTIPVLSVYGAKDTQVDPQQGAKAYRESLEKAGNPFFTVKILPNTDHNMSQAKTGCLNEQKKRRNTKMAEGLVPLLYDWLEQLNKHLK